MSAAAPARRAGRRRRLRRRRRRGRGPGASTAPPLGAAVLALAAAVVILVEGRHTTFFFDEWDFLLGRRGHSAGDFLRGQNGNPSLFPVALFKALLQVFGADGHWAFRTALLVLHLIVAGLVLVVARRRVGLAGGAVAAALVLVLGRASDDLIWAFQTGFLLSVLGGLAALAALDGERPGPRRPARVSRPRPRPRVLLDRDPVPRRRARRGRRCARPAPARLGRGWSRSRSTRCGRSATGTASSAGPTSR